MRHATRHIDGVVSTGVGELHFVLDVESLQQSLVEKSQVSVLKLLKESVDLSEGEDSDKICVAGQVVESKCAITGVLILTVRRDQVCALDLHQGPLLLSGHSPVEKSSNASRLHEFDDVQLLPEANSAVLEELGCLVSVASLFVSGEAALEPFTG